MFQADLDGGFGGAVKDAGSAFLGSLANQLSNKPAEKSADQNQPQDISGEPSNGGNSLANTIGNPKTLLIAGGAVLAAVALYSAVK